MPRIPKIDFEIWKKTLKFWQFNLIFFLHFCFLITNNFEEKNHEVEIDENENLYFSFWRQNETILAKNKPRFGVSDSKYILLVLIDQTVTFMWKIEPLSMIDNFVTWIKQNQAIIGRGTVLQLALSQNSLLKAEGPFCNLHLANKGFY